MSRIAWPRLMRAGLHDLRLAPAELWDLTPAELLVMLGGGNTTGPLDRATLDDLIRAYPDNRDGKGS